MPAPVFRTLEGLAPYEETVTAMAAHAAAIRNGGAGEEVWLLEHHSVLTGGTSSRPEDLMNPGGTPVHRTGRGGQWTWHGPGQRVAYVMLDLQRRQPDVRAYVHALEGWIIDVLTSFGIDGQRRDGHPGIWVDGDGRMDKVAGPVDGRVRGHHPMRGARRWRDIAAAAGAGYRYGNAGCGADGQFRRLFPRAP